MTSVIYPPDRWAESSRTRVVFLAGPIQGAPRWQERAIELLDGCGATIANPRTTGEWHGDYNGQVDWELALLERASYSGVILFWLARPNPDGVQPEGRAYAQTSRFELGEWVGRVMYHGTAQFVLGVEPGFSNERYIRRRIGNLWPDREIASTLERTVELCREALAPRRRR